MPETSSGGWSNHNNGEYWLATHRDGDFTQIAWHVLDPCEEAGDVKWGEVC